MRRVGPALLACAAVVAPLGSCGGDGDATSSPTQPPTTQAQSPTIGEPATDESAPHADEPAAGDDSGEGTANQPSADERAVAQSVRRYVAAIDNRDGDALCALLAQGAIDEVEVPRDRGSCAASLAASIGYRDPRGLPVWKTARVADLRSVEVTDDSAKVIVTTVTRFADRAEVSVEDDVVYLQRSGGGWLIAKPSSTLYRAVGVADVPPSVLSPG
jgi:hypothetical protein